TDDETAPTVTLSASPANIAENGGVSTLTVTLSTATYEDVVVDLTYAGTATGSGTDYTAAASTITIVAGNTIGTTTVTSIDDMLSEGSETVIADIDAVNGGDATEDGTQQATVTITDDDGPIALDDIYDIDEDGTLNDDVSINDSGLDNTPITFNVIDDVDNGTLVLNDDGTFTYIPNPNFTGDDTFTYEVCDATPTCATAVVTITVNPVNDPIYANDDIASVNEDGTLNGTTVLDNDGDDDGSILNINTVPIINTQHGDLIINSDGTYTYIPDDNYYGDDYFVYEVCNDETPQECTTATVVITVNPVNDEPYAIDDYVSTDMGAPVSGNVIPNDFDIDEDDLIVNTTLLSDPTNGSVVINADGSFIYTPNTDFIGTDVFIYEVCDNGVPQLCSHAIVYVTVTEQGDLFANDDYAEVDEDGTLNGSSVLDNDGDNDGSILIVNTTPVDDVNNGTLVFNDDGTYTYTPDEDFFGEDSFTYEVCNDETPQQCETATVIIVVNPVNDAPNAEDDIVYTNPGTEISGNVLPNDDDTEGDDLTVNTTPLSGPDNGEIVINDDGTFTYIPDDGFVGSDTIVYQVCDNGVPQECDTAYIIIEVLDDGTLYANDDYAIVNEDGNLIGTTVLVNDGDSNGSTLTVNTSAVNDVNNGTLVLNSDGTYTYTPDPDFTGQDSFTYEVCNDEDPIECATATVTITVLPDNDNLFANDDIASVDEDGVLFGSTVLVNDGDNDGGNLIVSIIPVNYPENGTVTINEDGTYTYVPFPDFNGEDSFTYQVCNDENPQECEIATVTITVNPVNDAPNAEDDLIFVDEGGIVTGDVLPNDDDVDGDDLTVNTTPLSGPDNGEIVINDDGTFTYIPDDGFVGTDTIVYEVCDNGDPQQCDSAYIIIEVIGAGTLFANDDYVQIDEDEILNGTTVLVNDGDSDGSTLTVNSTPVDDVENGTLVLNSDGTFTYTPDPDFNGEDIFVYEVCNDEDPQECSTATVIITVNPVNDAPNAQDDIIFTEEDVVVTGNVLPNDDDIDGDDLTVNTTPLSGPDNGEIVINDDGTFTYTPDPGFVGTDTIVYEVCDNGVPQQCDSAYIIIEVGAVGVLYANDDFRTVNEDNILYGATVLENDGDSDGSVITVNTNPVSNVSHGILTLNWNGSFTYSPDPNYFGEDQFTYEISNDETPQEFAQATVFITVNPVNDPPLAVDDYVTVVANGFVSDNVLNNDSDIDGDNLIVNTTPISDPTNGTVNLNADGSFTYTPNVDFIGTDYFVYEVCDDGLPQLCSQALVIITVTEDNVPLVANDDAVSVNEDEILEGSTVLANDVDDPANTLTVNTNPVVDVTNGTLVLNSDGTFTYTPNEDYFGTDMFEYEVSNDENPQETDVATVTITVNPVNDDPIAVNDTLSGNVDQDISGDVSVNDLGLGDKPVVFTVDTDPINGVVDFNDDGTFTYSPDANFNGQDSIVYIVTDLDGQTSKATILLDVIPVVTYDVVVPEGFSPNGDGINEFFEIEGLENYPNNTIVIINRWGNKLYEAAPYNNDWDGTNLFGVSVGDNNLPEATYFYILDLGDGSAPIKGYIYLKK
ncbi:MAG: tandem-95 repeat protein, partial [Bacteroidales bacterium]|nr:tandem-95 repeat protein [Bacteroidales bacterium]